MSAETIGLVVGVVLVGAVLFPVLRRYRKIGFGIFILLAALAGMKWLLVDQLTLHHDLRMREFLAELPILHRERQYVSSNQCLSCHTGQYHSWHRTYHRTMTQVALPENVIGEFDGSVIHSNGLEYRVYEEDGEFWAEMPDPEEMMYVVQGGKPLALEEIPRVRRRVTMTTGSHHYQTYWVEGADRYGNLQQTLPLVYLIRDKRWIPREEAFMMPPESSRMITQWNDHCIKCHSTGANPGLQTDTREGSFETSVGELGISCEACHGPGEAHVAINSSPIRRYWHHLTGQNDDTMINPEKLDHRRSSQVCGQCHGVYVHGEAGWRYATEGVQYFPGDDLHATRHYIFYPDEDSTQQQWEELRNNREFFRERWWDDGTMLAGGREYTAMAVSGCYTKGTLSCLSCHSMHDAPPADQVIPGMDTNQACTQCHTEPEYTSNLIEHTHHPAESSGSECMNCHMPHTEYALFGALRNHQIQSPSIDRSIEHGTPNACNLCHLDKTLDWSQQAMQEWYGHEPQALNEEQQTVSAYLLWLLKGHAAQRVIAAWHTGWEPALEVSGRDWQAPFQAYLLNDPYGVVRYVAEHRMTALPGYGGFSYDYLDAAAVRQDSVDQVREQWLNQMTTSPVTGSPAILLDDQGLIQSEIDRLLSERDNRPVTIKE